MDCAVTGAVVQIVWIGRAVCLFDRPCARIPLRGRRRAESIAITKKPHTFLSIELMRNRMSRMQIWIQIVLNSGRIPGWECGDTGNYMADESWAPMVIGRIVGGDRQNLVQAAKPPPNQNRTLGSVMPDQAVLTDESYRMQFFALLGRWPRCGVVGITWLVRWSGPVPISYHYFRNRCILGVTGNPSSEAAMFFTQEEVC